MVIVRTDPLCDNPSRVRYAAAGCRCPGCRAEQRDYCRIWRSNRGRRRR